MSVETSNLKAQEQFNNYRERCDRCSAQAQKRVNKVSYELMFCNHHFHDHEDVLIMSGWVLEIPTTEPVDAKSSELVDA